MNKFPERLKELMFYRGNMKSEELAKTIGVSGSSVRSWCNGTQNIYLSNMIKLADFFECSLDFLAGLTDYQDTVKPIKCPPFYENLRKVMKEEGITRYSLTKKGELNDTYFTQWKRGADVHINTLLYLAKQIKCTLDHLVGREN